MVASNPLFHGRWTAKRFGATVLDDIWQEVTIFTLFATLIVLISEKTNVSLGVSNQLLTVLGLVLGLVISFRTSSAYERYQEGRKMWTTIMVASKNLAQMIWIHVPIDRNPPTGSQSTTTPLENVIEKKTMINLIQAFAVSVKHLLRGEEGVYYEDLYPLLSFLPRYGNEPAGNNIDEVEKLPLWHISEAHVATTEPRQRNVRSEDTTRGSDINEKTLTNRTAVNVPVGSDSGSESIAVVPLRNGNYSLPARSKTFDPEAALPRIESTHPLMPARNPPVLTMYDHFPILRLFRWIGRIVTCRFRGQAEESTMRKKRKPYSKLVEGPIPLEITLVLSNYSAWLMRNGLVQPAIASGITTNLFLLQDTVSNLERICNTPLPFAYQAHLRMSLWIYLILLPFQIYTPYGWITIPATAFASFLLLGFLEIGQEIENPFNYDYNDLDLDYFCLVIQRDLHEITTHTNPDPTSFVFSRLNVPLAPSDRRHAQELTKDGKEYYAGDANVEPGMGSIRKTLVSGWKMVDELTRKK